MVSDALEEIEASVPILIVGTTSGINADLSGTVSEDDILDFVSDLQMISGMDIDYIEVDAADFCSKDNLDRLILDIGAQMSKIQNNSNLNRAFGKV